MSSSYRPMSMFGPNEQGLVDKFIGTAYDTVKLVSINMDHVIRVSTDIDNIEQIADAAFKKAIDTNMPDVYNTIDAYTESKKPEIDGYVGSAKKDITDHTLLEIIKIDEEVEKGKIAIDTHVSDKVLEVDTQVDLAKGYAADAKQSAKESSDSAASTLNQLNLNKAQVALATAEAEKAKTQATNAASSASLANTSAVRAETALSEARKSANQAETAKDTAVSASVSADYARQEAFRSETDVKRIQGEVNAKATQVETNAQKTSEDRSDAKRFRDESEGFKTESGESAKTSEYWAEKAKEYSGMDTSAFVNRADLAQTTGEALDNPMSQKAVTDSLKTKAGASELTQLDQTLTNKINNQIVQELGVNEDKTISQKKLSSELNLKAVKTDVETSLATKVDKTQILNEMGNSTTDTVSQDAITKAIAAAGNKDEINTALATKLDKSAVKNDLGDSKVDTVSQSLVKTNLNLKADISTVNTAFNLKADKTELSDGLNTKLDKTAVKIVLGDSDTVTVSQKLVKTELNKKVNQTQVKSVFGNSTSNVASQKIVTDVNNLVTNANTKIDQLQKNGAFYFGVIYSTILPVAPEGCFLLDGGTFDVLGNPKLAEIYPDGVLPNLSDRVLLGSSTEHVAGAFVNQEMMAHTHSASADNQGNHSHRAWTDAQGNHQHGYTTKAQHGIAGGSLTGYWYGDAGAGTEWAGNHSHTVGMDGAGLHSHNITVGSAGGAKNRVDSFVVNYFILGG